MNKYKILLVLLIFGLNIFAVDAQVKFKLTKLEEATYQVSLISEETIQSPLNVTGTTQITLKAPTNGLAIGQLTSLQPGIEWDQNSKSITPIEAPDADYFSFGLVTVGTKAITYQAGLEVPLFTFTNLVECQGEIGLMDNAKDPFSPPNSRQVNIGNHITILGAGGDAYIGNAAESVVSCQGFLTHITQIEKEVVKLNIFPNPTTDYVVTTFNWDRKGEEIDIQIRDLQGKLVRSLPVEIITGINEAKIDIQSLAEGSYFIELIGAAWKINSAPFLKMRR